MEKQFVVISHTHWDREWYQSFDLFRMRLVDLMDHLLDILQENEEYVFHLDAQTIVLEDYLEIRPSKRQVLEGYIRENRILVGPWYVQNDFFLSSGESTIRNLQIGTKMAKAFGGCMNVGYCPDQFGIIGQLPQILKGFGIGSFVFGRGNNRLVQTENGAESLRSPAELLWEGTDKTVIPTISLSYWYNNAQRFPQDPEQAQEILTRCESQFEGLARTPYLLLMNGVDHLEAQEDLLPILESLNGRLGGGRRVFQGRLPAYIDQVFAYVREQGVTLPRETGELRRGSDYSVLQGTLSSRVYLKQANDLCEDMLAYRLEPLYTMLDLSGIHLYPTDYLEWLWKFLVQNHAHDSICGCSQDVVHRHMEERFNRVIETAEKLIDKGMTAAAHRLRLPALRPEDYRLTLANTTQSRRREIVEAEVYFPQSEAVRSFSLIDRDGREVDYTLIEQYDTTKCVYSPINLPQEIACDGYRIRFQTPVLEPYSLDGLAVKVHTAYQPLHEQRGEGTRIGNGLLEAAADADGTVTVTDCAAGRILRDFLSLEDTADMGDAYVFGELKGDTPILSFRRLVSCETVQDRFYSALILRYCLPIPAEKTENGRSGVLVDHPFTIELRLYAGRPVLEIRYQFENRAGDHRTRLCLHTGVETPVTRSLSAFELVDREIGSDYVPEVRGVDQPNAGLIFLENAETSAAIYNRGLHEYAHMDETGKVALTLVRATDRITKGSSWLTPENQCRRPLSGCVFVEFGVSAAGAVQHVAALRNPLLVQCSSADPNKFSEGRPVVQDSETKEIFVRQDAFSTVDLEPGQPLLCVEGEAVVVSACKRAAEGGCILRLCNMSGEPQTAAVQLPVSIGSASCVSLSENEVLDRLAVEGHRIRTALAPWQILTLRLEEAASANV